MKAFALRAGISVLLLVSVPAVATSPRQAAYDAAQAAFDKGDWRAAIDGFTPLVSADTARPLKSYEAVIAGLIGQSLTHIGKPHEARGWIDRALAAAPAEEQAGLLLAAGDAARFDYDYPGAVAFYDKAFALGDVNIRLNAGLGIGYAGATADPKRAADRLDVVLADPALKAKPQKQTLALVEDLRARAALNLGDLNGAQVWATRAVADSGGLTISQVSPQQVAIRGNAAIVERLRGNDEKTREYLTYTGAGHMPDMKWISGYEGEAPVCGVDGAARPEDSVVIEIAIDEDGHVEGALPIYASRPGELGVAFAQKVNRWRWDPAKLKDINGFWRSTLRLEMRCASRPEPERLSAPYRAVTWRWLAEKGAVAGEKPENFYAANDPRLSGRYGRAVSILFGPVADDTAALDTELDAVDAPPAAHALLINGLARHRGDRSSSSSRGWAGSRAATYARLVPAFRQRFPAARAGPWLELEWALALEDSGQLSAAVPRLEAVLATPEAVLPQDDPVRSVALLHAALVGMRGGDPAQARARLAASGLGAEQCALFDTHPVPSSTSVSSSQFPMEALHWHFEGYVQEAYDIGPDGHVANVRTVLAYPPFVFGPSTEKAVRQFRYLPPSIDGKPVGCNGETQAVNYRIPG